MPRIEACRNVTINEDLSSMDPYALLMYQST